MNSETEATTGGTAGGKRAARGTLVLTTALAVALFAHFVRPARGDEEEWCTAAEFRAAWESPIGVTWADNPLRSALAKLSRQCRIAMWVDRRIDPERRLSLSIANEPFGVGCQRIAAKIDAAVGRVGPVVYIGPPAVADRLATVAALRRGELEQVAVNRRSTFTAPKSLRWDDLAEPRQLIKDLAREAGLETPDLERRVPHDLWPAASLPPLVWSDRLTLILAGFDLTFVRHEVEGTLELVPLPESPTIEKTMAVKGGPAKVAAELADKFPQAELRVVGTRLVVRGRFEDLEMIERVARGERVERARVVPGPSEFSLKVENQPAGAVVRHIAKQLMLTLDVAPDAVEALEQRVSFSAERLRLSDLLDTVLRGTGLQFELQDQRLLIRRGAKP